MIKSLSFTFFVFIILGLLFVVPLHGQYREYYIYGKVTDHTNQPLEKVQIALQDIETSRNYGTKTDKNGEFKLAGLPHGVYSVTISKEGYKTRTDEWRFEAPQDRMQKVEVKTTVLVSEQVVKEIERSKQMEGLFKEATEKTRAQDFDSAIKLLQKILSENPQDANALYLQGVCLLNKQQVPEAIDTFSTVIQLTPNFAGAYYQLGIAYQKDRENEKALTNYQKALALEPQNLISLYNGGLILFEFGRIDEAITYFERALKVKADAPEILEVIGMSYLKKEEYPKTIEYLERAKKAYTDENKIKALDELITTLKKQ